ncbi:MAG TPA: pilus assembly protein TadG-related protein [Acidimicrobiia bacterium]|jgi:hypothetical protein
MKLIERLENRIAPVTAEGEDADPKQRGATLILATLVLVTLMGMAGFAVDLGWLYLKTTEAQKAAEASALAGVVHMPYPASVPFAASEAHDTAIDVAARNGYTSGSGTTVTPQPVAGRPNRLNVQVATTAPTFFMKVFGLDSVSFMRDATAEQLPPLKLGSDEPYLGSDPTDPTRNRFFFVAINGEREPKENGDPFSTRCVAACSSGTPNPQYIDPAYYYAVEVPDSEVGQSMNIQIYDGPHWRNNQSNFLAGNPLATGDRADPPSGFALRFTLFAPDQTPGNPADNPAIPGCSRTYGEASSGTSAGVREWTSVCTVTATKGLYVLAVSIDGNGRAISDFSIRTLVGGNQNSGVDVYGLGAMSLDMIQAGVTANFKIVKLEDIYAGTQLVISLFDPGDISGGFANLSFDGEAAAWDCGVRIYNHAKNPITGWTGDDSPGSAPCLLNTSGQRFNNQWVEFRFDIPSTYTCAIDCWLRVTYNFAPTATVTERTTWGARINGQPIHLLP